MLSKMRVLHVSGNVSGLTPDQIQSLFRYVANLENRVLFLEKKQKMHSHLLQKIFRRFNIFRRVTQGFAPLKNKFIKRNEECRKAKERNKAVEELHVPVFKATAV